jgi:hypothetical protein
VWKRVKHAQYLSMKDAALLQSTLRTKAVPCAHRGLDINVCYSRYHALLALTSLSNSERGEDKEEMDLDSLIIPKQDDWKSLNRALFMMSLFTMTGKTAYYDVYKREMDVPFAIPCTEEQVEKFPLYLDTVVTDRSSGRVSCIVSKQHEKMIPDALKRGPGLKSFIRRMAESLLDCDNGGVLQMGAESDRGKNLAAYAKRLEYFMTGSTSNSDVSSKDKLRLRQIASFIFSNVGEVYRDPFGKAKNSTDLVPGFGG